MHLYRRKRVILPLLIVVSFLAWQSYLHIVESHRPSLKEIHALTDIADQVYAIMLNNNLDWVTIKNGWVDPESLQEETFNTLIKNIESVNDKIDEATFSYQCRDKCYFTANFYIDIPPPRVIDGPYRYLQYNPDGHLKRIVHPEYRQNKLTEFQQYNQYGWNEEFVPSISEARKEGVGKVYFFCEPLEQEYWHFCRGEYL
jgi:hypothetical protein